MRGLGEIVTGKASATAATARLAEERRVALVDCVMRLYIM